MNKVILSGNLCRDVEIKMTTTNKEVVSNCVAVRREYKNEEGIYDCDFINIVIWGNQAKYIGEYASKGDRVELVGRWQTRKYEDAKGETKILNEVVVESITAFSTSARPSETEEPEITEDDLPF
jgi:single-strand DNA-binding protein